MNNDYIPSGGVNQLIKTAEGRKYLAKLQKKYEMDIIQPSDPRFKKVYGSAIKQRQKTKELQERKSRDEWSELQEKKAYAKQHNKGMK